MDGVLVVDKPEGLTSHDVVALARRALGERRIGHTGTLDPLATGVLPLACGRATRLVRFLTAADKTYVAGIRFGVSTDTYDITGRETGRTDRRPAREDVVAAIGSLTGAYLQEPPAFSAKKVGGARAHEQARAGRAVTLEAVPVVVSRAELLDWTGDACRVELTCSAGFYVRSFAHELGVRVGTGACLESLRRTRSGAFDLSRSVTVETLAADAEAALRSLVPPNELLTHLPAARLTAEGRERAAHGMEIKPRHVEQADALTVAGAEWIRLIGPDGALIGIGTGSPAALHPRVVLI